VVDPSTSGRLFAVVLLPQGLQMVCIVVSFEKGEAKLCYVPTRDGWTWVELLELNGSY
jgi:hypothetical protein